MIGLIFILIIGLAIVYFSGNSTSGIMLTIGSYQYPNIPLFVIAVGTYLLGIFLAWIIDVPHAVSTILRTRGLNSTIKSGHNTILQLQNKINKLEEENIKLRNRNQSIETNKQTGDNNRPNFINNLLHKLNLR